ncbi:TPA: hypothetical protein EYP38_02595 [Candidatus Micrarchaeota archaeon]|nr:hypothetical protein [Candidatus Micrarchaeota archaeon]
MTSNTGGEREKKRGFKTVTIRNIDEEVYSRVVSLAKSLGVTAGELVNESLRLLLSLTARGVEVAKGVGKGLLEEGLLEGLKRKDFVSIGDVDELVITRKDLEEVDKPVMIRNVKKLTFAADVSEEIFDRKIKSIVFVDELVIPGHLPKLKVLSRSRMVRTVKVGE